MLNKLALTFPKYADLSDAKIDAYCEGLEGISTPRIARSMADLVRYRKYNSFPTVAEIIDMLPTPEYQEVKQLPEPEPTEDERWFTEQLLKFIGHGIKQRRGHAYQTKENMKKWLSTVAGTTKEQYALIDQFWTWTNESV